jgi:hypothetical protein
VERNPVKQLAPTIIRKGDSVKVTAQTPPPPGVCYWRAEWDTQANLEVNPLKPGELLKTPYRCFQAFLSSSSSGASPNNKNAARDYAKSNYQLLPPTGLTMYRLSTKPQCRDEPNPKKANAALTACDDSLAGMGERLQGCEDAKRDCRDYLDRCERARKDAEDAWNLERKRTRSLSDEKERELQTKVDQLTWEKGKTTEELQTCQRRLRPGWLTWAAAALATVATAWTAWEIHDLKSASDAYDNAPPGSPDLGSRHIAVVEAKGRLVTAGVAAALGWTWTASLIEW